MKFPPIEVPGDGTLHARLITSQGAMVVRLEEKRAPTVVANFVGLATGRIDYEDPKGGKIVRGVPFYDGLLFHRIVRNFIIQSGDPMTRYPEMADDWGKGGPGYKFPDEFHAELRHNRAGVISMANSGPNTNGSQWFITEVPTPHLDHRHSAFGLVVGGQDVIKKIANIPVERNRPTRDIVLERVEVFRQ
jgi:peptidyl-prolyl cis-trans isomerase A (cyclophilin A)